MHCHKMQMDAKLSMEMFERVFELGSRGCMAVANYMQEVQVFYFFCRFDLLEDGPLMHCII